MCLRPSSFQDKLLQRLKKNTFIVLDLANCEISEKDFSLFCASLKTSQALEGILFFDRPFSSLKVKDFSSIFIRASKGLRQNRNLRHLDFVSNRMAPKDFISLIKALGQSCINSLRLSANLSKGSTKETSLALVSLLKNNPFFRHLHLWRNGLNDEHLALLAPHLNSLYTLDLYQNKIGDSGALALSKSLQKKTQLTCLNLASNELTDVAAKSFLRLVKLKVSLCHFTIWENHISALYTNKIAIRVKKNQKILVNFVRNIKKKAVTQQEMQRGVSLHTLVLFKGKKISMYQKGKTSLSRYSRPSEGRICSLFSLIRQYEKKSTYERLIFYSLMQGSSFPLDMSKKQKKALLLSFHKKSLHLLLDFPEVLLNIVFQYVSPAFIL